MEYQRKSGILLHPTSLPGPYGVGSFNQAAYDWIDFLIRSRQSLWQVLPLGPTGYGDSPYACFSAFAGNTLLVSPERLAQDGLLGEDDLASVPAFSDEEHVDFERANELKQRLLEKAFALFQRTTDTALRSSFQAF